MVSSSLSNIAYSSQQINTAYPLPLDTIKNDKAFNDKVGRLSKMDDDLFTYEVEVANIPCDSKMDNDLEQEADDDMGYDPSDVAFVEWLGSKNFN
ncbi:hypothetical protein Tco_1578180 [Tanacetum coccineum]